MLIANVNMYFFIFRSVVGRSAFAADHGDCTNSIVYKCWN